MTWNFDNLFFVIFITYNDIVIEFSPPVVDINISYIYIDL
jgi:hypothetical protein